MAPEPSGAARLADRLKELRVSSWPGESVTQTKLAAAFSTESDVASATISGWESPSNAKIPTPARLTAYARFFATRRSLDGSPHLVPVAELEEDERQRYQQLEEELLELLQGDEQQETTYSAPRSTFTFNDGPVTVICSEAPADVQGRLARENDPNFTKLQQYGDLDALIEMYGHLRAYNPSLEVFHRLSGDVLADDMSTHVILLGGIAWNQVTKRFQEATRQVPIVQIDVAGYAFGEPFEVTTDNERFEPTWEDNALTEDIAFLARLPNPFNTRRTLTICNGVHSRGVLGAVRCLTDSRVREANEQYLADRFPDGRFALLLRVPVIANRTLSPDLQNPTARLYEWPHEEGAR